MNEIRILSATGILGSGFKEETMKRAMAREPHFIGADSGSTDPGPHYLGSGDTLFSDSAYKRDLRLMLLAGRAAKVPVIVGSACTSGSDPHLERLVGITRDIAREEKLNFRFAAIHSEQDKTYLKDKLRERRITPLANAPELDEAVIDRSAHIVGMAGIEPFVEALQNGADVIIAGRSSDTSIFSAMPVMRGLNPATVWHAAKILECGAACVVQRKYPDCNFAIVRDDHFIVDPTESGVSLRSGQRRLAQPVRELDTLRVGGAFGNPEYVFAQSTRRFRIVRSRFRAAPSNRPRATPSSSKAPSSPAIRRSSSAACAIPSF